MGEKAKKLQSNLCLQVVPFHLPSNIEKESFTLVVSHNTLALPDWHWGEGDIRSWHKGARSQKALNRSKSIFLKIGTNGKVQLWVDGIDRTRKSYDVAYTTPAVLCKAHVSIL